MFNEYEYFSTSDFEWNPEPISVAIPICLIPFDVMKENEWIEIQRSELNENLIKTILNITFIFIYGEESDGVAWYQLDYVLHDESSTDDIRSFKFLKLNQSSFKLKVCCKESSATLMIVKSNLRTLEWKVSIESLTGCVLKHVLK